jgi:hypothetical protein
MFRSGRRVTVGWGCLRWALLASAPVLALPHAPCEMVVPLLYVLLGRSPRLVLVAAFPADRWRSTTRPFRRVLGLLAGRSPPAAQGPCQQSTVQERQQHQDRRRQSRRAREGNPPVKGDCSAQPRMRRGDRAAVRRPVRRHLLMAPRPDRRAFGRLCGTRGPMTARAARGHQPTAGATGEEAAADFSHSFVVSTSASLKLCTSISSPFSRCCFRCCFLALFPCHVVC